MAGFPAQAASPQCLGRVNQLYSVKRKDEILLNEDGPDVRDVFRNVAHSAHPTTNPYGESVVHYEDG